MPEPEPSAGEPAAPSAPAKLPAARENERLLAAFLLGSALLVLVWGTAYYLTDNWLRPLPPSPDVVQARESLAAFPRWCALSLAGWGAALVAAKLALLLARRRRETAQKQVS